MRIVIGGGSEVAVRLAMHLMDLHDVFVVALPESIPQRLESLDVQVVPGSPTAATALRKAGAEDARVFIACSDNDERNLVSCVAAKKLGVPQTVCFLFRREFSSTTRDDDHELAESLGIDHVIRPGQQLAEEIVRIVAVPGALDLVELLDGRVQLLRHQVEGGAALTAGPLRDVGLVDGIVLVAARRGDEMFLPKGDTEFRPGDKVTAMGTPRAVDRFLRKQLRSRRSATTRSHTVTIVGGGTVGLEIACGLERRGWTVKLIEANKKRCEDIAPMVKGMVLHGDGSDLELLEQERVADEAVLIAVTSHDEKNLLVSLLARQIGVPRIVTRADALANERLFEKVGIDVVRSARGAAVNAIAQRYAGSRTELIAELEHGEAEVIELILPAEVRPVRLRDLRQGVFAIVGAIQRGEDAIVPDGDTEIRGGDRILVFCPREDEEAVREFFLETLAEPEA